MKFKTNAFAHAATRGAGLLAAAAMAWMPQTTRAQDLTLDDFSTGPGKLEATSGSHTVSQTGTGIVGGTRNISLVYGKKDKSEFGQESTLQVRPSTSKNVPSALIWSNGFDATPGIELEYFGLNQDTPLNLNLTNYDRFRVGFQGSQLASCSRQRCGTEAILTRMESSPAACRRPTAHSPSTFLFRHSLQARLR
jgi:hypothetical protein